MSKFFFDAGALVGIGIFVFGLYLWWHPLAAIVGGLLLAGACIFAGYDQARTAAIGRIRSGGK